MLQIKSDCLNQEFFEKYINRRKEYETSKQGGGDGGEQMKSDVCAISPSSLISFHPKHPVAKFVQKPKSISGRCRPNDTLGMPMTPICRARHPAERLAPLTHTLFNLPNEAKEIGKK